MLLEKSWKIHVLAGEIHISLASVNGATFLLHTSPFRHALFLLSECQVLFCCLNPHGPITPHSCWICWIYKNPHQLGQEMTGSTGKIPTSVFDNWKNPFWILKSSVGDVWTLGSTPKQNIQTCTLWWTYKTLWKITILMGKSTISMAVFNCYVSSPEGIIS